MRWVVAAVVAAMACAGEAAAQPLCVRGAAALEAYGLYGDASADTVSAARRLTRSRHLTYEDLRLVERSMNSGSVSAAIALVEAAIASATSEPKRSFDELKVALAERCRPGDAIFFSPLLAEIPATICNLREVVAVTPVAVTCVFASPRESRRGG